MAFPQQVTCSEIQLDLILDYRTNPELHPAFQRYFREKQSPFLAAWGKNDPFFLLAGAEALQARSTKGRVYLLDADHFALETHADEIGRLMLDFLGKQAV